MNFNVSIVTRVSCFLSFSYIKVRILDAVGDTNSFHVFCL